MILLDLMGGVALLLWGLHMVHSGNRARLRLRSAAHTHHWPSQSLLRASLPGLLVTLLLQSSTATGLMTATLSPPAEPWASSQRSP